MTLQKIMYAVTCTSKFLAFFEISFIIFLNLQRYDEFYATLDWVELIGTEGIASVLVRSFFPKVILII